MYGDYRFDTLTQQVVPETAYLPGIGQADANTGAVLYYHADQIGSLRMVTDADGNVVSRFVYSAFGETILAEGPTPGSPPVATRYRYGGAWGYESGLIGGVESDPGAPALPFIHVGYRWYDPSTGRFLQRDPIGIRGGFNVYVYAGNCPTMGVDPLGLDIWGRDTVVVDWVARNIVMRFYRVEELADMSDAGIVTRAVGASAFLGFGGYMACGYGIALYNGTAGMMNIGYGSGSFVFAAGNSGWLLGDPNTGSIIRAGLDPTLMISLPVRFISAVQGRYGPATGNCFTTMLRELLRGL